MPEQVFELSARAHDGFEDIERQLNQNLANMYWFKRNPIWDTHIDQSV